MQYIHASFFPTFNLFLGGKCVLFFGSRSRYKDYFFEDEWVPLQSDGRLTLFTAFSRDQVIVFFKRFIRKLQLLCSIILVVFLSRRKTKFMYNIV